MLDLARLKLNPNENVNMYIVRAQKLAQEITQLGKTVTERELVRYIVEGLTPNFDTITAALSINREISLPDLRQTLLDFEKKRQDRSKNHENAFRSSGNQLKEKSCFICKRKGHFKKDSWFNPDNKGNQKNTTNKNNMASTRNYHKGPKQNKDTARSAIQERTEEPSRRRGSTSEYALHASTREERPTTQDVWIIDSACTSHMTSHGEWIEHKTEDRRSIQVAEEGRHIESASSGLIQATVQGAYIYSSDDKLIGTGNFDGNMYTLNLSRLPETTHVPNEHCLISKDNSRTAWHRRLGHPSDNKLDLILKNNLLKGLDSINGTLDQCDACSLGKMTKVPYVHTDSNQESYPFEAIYVDLCGPMRINSLGGSKYFLTIIDGFSRRIFVKFLKDKLSAAEVLKKFIVKRENELNSKLKRLRTDNGTEFINKNLETFIESKGIKHELTTPHTPRSNGRVERANRTLLDKGRTLLADSQLPLHFWAEAVNTAAYLYNLIPTTSDPDTTPKEKWKGKKPSVSHIMRFGCEVFYKLENHQRHKLEAKSKRGIFVGYSRCRRAYRVFDITARVILETADIHFRENNNVISEEKQSDNNTDTDTYFFIQEDEQLDNHVLSDVDIEEPAPDTMINRQTESSGSDRPQRTQTIPERFDDYVLATTNETIPKDYDEAIACEDKKHWENAMLEEIQNMYSHQVWELVPRPVNAKVVKSKWVFKISKDQENKTYKARLVAMGYNQIPGRDYNESFSPVIKNATLRTILSMAATKDSVILPFISANEDKYFYVGIYVDDFITVSDSEDTSNRFINKLRHHLEIKDVTCKGMFLGIKIIQDKEGISLQQSHYVQQILQKYGMETCKEVPTPGSKEINLDNHIEDDNCDQHTYQEALGMLMFLAVNTRPDIAYITSKLSQYSRQPKQMHWTAIKRVMRYLRGTIDLGVKFEREKTGILKSYTDASWSTTHDGKSYGGYVLKLGEATIDWKSSKQPLVALSTMEAEMIAACESCCQIKWIINLLRELEEWNFMKKPTAIYTDSQSLINWISSPKQSSRCRHINRKYHFLRDCYESRDICLLYKPSQDLEADIFTKDLSRDQMKKHLENLSIVGIKAKVTDPIQDSPELKNKAKMDCNFSPTTKIEPLTGTNYPIWALKVEALLRGKKLFKCVISDPEPDIKDEVAWQIWSEKNDEAFGIIVTTLSDEQAGMFLDETKAKKVWDELKKIYTGKLEDKIIDIGLELKNIKMKNNESINEYMARAKNIASQSSSLGHQISQRELAFHIVRGIHPRLEKIAVVLITRRNLTLDEIRQSLREEENRMNSGMNGSHSDENEQAYRSKDRRNHYQQNRQKECFVCHKKGHLAKDCWFKNKRTQEQHGRRNANSNTNYNKQNFRNNANTVSSKPAEQTFNTSTDRVFENSSNNYSQIQTWCLDSGCTTHLSPHLDWMENVMPYESEINLAEEGKVTHATAKGDINVSTCTENGIENVQIKGVLYVPNLRSNLLSIYELTNKGNTVIFNRDGAKIYNEQDDLIAEAQIQDRMYVMETRSRDEYSEKTEKVMTTKDDFSNDTISLWHRRLNHLNEAYMKEIIQRNVVLGFNVKFKNLPECEACIMGKLTRQPYHPVTTNCTTKPLELGHMDLCGPMPYQSLGYSLKRKAYRVYDIITKKIEEVRSVKFVENEKGIDYAKNLQEDTNYDHFSYKKEEEDDIEIDHRTRPETSELNEETIPTLDEPNEERIVRSGRKKGDTQKVLEEKHRAKLREGEMKLLEQGVRRSQRIKERNNVNFILKPEERIPENYEEAINCENKYEWLEAIKEELYSIDKHKVWTLVQREKNMKIINCKWIFSMKSTPGDGVYRRKARFVAIGCNQKYGVEYEESFSPVIRKESLCAIVALAAHLNLVITSYDVKTAYLYGELKETIFMKQPEGFVENGEEDKVCKLLKSIYGLPQSGHCWNKKINEMLIQLGMERSQYDPCVYTFRKGKEYGILGLYVDDLIIAGTDKTFNEKLASEIGRFVALKKKGRMNLSL
ncbi:hypothetical protein LAZ67_15002623, partial [Cordylochernes scorpioides]